MKAVCLLSGGLDSTTCLAWARREGYEIYALSFDYGQRHRVELEAARRVADALGAEAFRIAKIDLRVFGHSALTDDIDVPKHRNEAEMTADIPITYVPARNTIFLSFALAWAEVLGAADVVIGVNALDYSGYPDCRPEFIEAFEKMANLATRTGVEGTTKLKIRKLRFLPSAREGLSRGWRGGSGGLDEDLRDLLFCAGRRFAGWRAFDLCTGDGLQSSLLLVRYALYFVESRRRRDVTRCDPGRDHRHVACREACGHYGRRTDDRAASWGIGAAV